MFTLWAITADSDAHVTENIKTRAAAIRAAREAQASGKLNSWRAMNKL